MTNMPERISDLCEAGRLGKSDHEMILFTVSTENTSEKVKREVPNWGQANWSNMRQALAATDWSQELHAKSAEEMWTTFRARVGDLVSKNVPVRVMHKRQRPIWMTNEILQAVKKKKRLWKAAKRSASYEQYKEMELKVKKLIRNAKRSFEKRLASGNGNNKRPFFSYVKQKTKSRSTIGPLKNDKKLIISDDLEMAELLNNFFGLVFTREDTTSIPAAEEIETGNMKELKITLEMVKAKIRNLKTASAAGPDSIGPRLLQELENELAPALVIILDSLLSMVKCLKTGKLQM